MHFPFADVDSDDSEEGSDDGSVDVPELQSLKQACRRTIRQHMLAVNETGNLFCRVPNTGLPPVLASYVLYDVSLTDSDFASETS